MSSTKKCTVCKEILSFDQFGKCKVTKNKLKASCKNCENKRNKVYYRKNKSKCLGLAAKNRLLYIQRNREFVLDYLRNHPCIDCGESDPVVLDFDHVRGQKIDAICYMISRGKSIKKIIAEIQKCEVRCANCHRRKTAKDFGYFRLGQENSELPEH